MAHRVPRDQSLQRVHGVGSLFSADYGNVSSSIYYALGVVTGPAAKRERSTIRGW